MTLKKSRKSKISKKKNVNTKLKTGKGPLELIFRKNELPQQFLNVKLSEFIPPLNGKEVIELFNKNKDKIKDLLLKVIDAIFDLNIKSMDFRADSLFMKLNDDIFPAGCMKITKDYIEIGFFKIKDDSLKKEINDLLDIIGPKDTNFKIISHYVKYLGIEKKAETLLLHTKLLDEDIDIITQMRSIDEIDRFWIEANIDDDPYLTRNIKSNQNIKDKMKEFFKNYIIKECDFFKNLKFHS